MCDLEPPATAQLMREASVPKAIAVVALWITSGLDGGTPRILFTRRRAGDHLAGCWELPGGKVESGETPQQAALREVREEVGIELPGESMTLLVEVEHQYPDRLIKLHAFLAPMPPAAKLCMETEYAWISIDALGDLDLPPANGPINAAIRRWLAEVP